MLKTIVFRCIEEIRVFIPYIPFLEYTQCLEHLSIKYIWYQ